MVVSILNTSLSVISIKSVGLQFAAGQERDINPKLYASLIEGVLGADTDLINWVTGSTLTVKIDSVALTPDEALRFLKTFSSLEILQDGSTVTVVPDKIDFIGASTPLSYNPVSGDIEVAISNDDVELGKNFYVAKNGDDSTATGSLSKPFLTIGACISYINANFTLSAAFNVSIIVAAGEYSENTLVIPRFCSLRGERYRTRIAASNPNADLIQCSGATTIQGLLLTGVTDTLSYLIRISTTTATRVTLQDLSLSTYEGVGTISNGILLTSTVSPLTVRVKQVDFDDITNNLITIQQNSRVFVRGAQVFACPGATFLHATSTAAYSIYNLDIDEINIGIVHNNTGASEVANSDLFNCDIPIQKVNSATLSLRSVSLDSTQAIISDENSIQGYFLDGKIGDESLKVFNELAVGTSSQGYESVFGEGDSYTIGMRVLTSDGTDTNTTEGVLTDVSDEAAAVDLANFGFQGTSANHCIYVTTDVQNSAFGSTDFARTVGLKIAQVTAVVETTPKSIVFEYWNGSAWAEGAVMATQSNLFYRYANNTFLRANSSEHIRFGKSLIQDNVKKTIDGVNRFWYRLRIKNSVTTAPTFNQFKISNNRTEINSNGTMTFHGLSRYTLPLPFQANTFGESGFVTDINFAVGSGSFGAGETWTHEIKNARFNLLNDDIFITAQIPVGTSTCCPVSVRIKYLVLDSGSSSNGTLRVSFLPVESENISIADPTGGVAPIPRSAANTSLVTSTSAAVEDLSINLSDTNLIYTAPTPEFDIANFYEGDILFIRVSYQNRGSGNKDIGIVGVELDLVKWTPGGL